MESYREIKKRHQAEVNAFPLGAAFSDKQFAEMMKKFGLPNDKSGYSQIVSLGCGVFMRKSDIPAWKEMSRRHEQELKDMRENRKGLVEALRYEFANHESQFSRDDEAVCNAVGLDWNEVQKDAELRALYDKAWKLFWNDCIKNDWF